MSRIALMFVATLLLACSPKGPVEAPESAEAIAVGGDWQLVDLNGASLLAGTEISLSIAGTDLGGSGGCNGIGGDASWDDGTVSFGELMMTTMACMEPGGVLGQESTYFALLNGMTTYTLAGSTLTLSNAQGETLVYERIIKEPIVDRPLEGVRWNAHTFLEGELASSLYAGTQITLIFEGGKLTGNGGCNALFGAYEAADGTLTITGVGNTEMACEDGIMEQEMKLTQRLTQITHFHIEGNRLTLTTNDPSVGMELDAQP